MLLETQIVIVVILIILSAFFSASESALLSLNRYKARYMVEKKRFGAIYVKKLKDHPERLLSTILIGNNVLNVAAAAIATSISLQIFESNAIGIATGVMTFLLLIFGEITPKTLATRNNEAFSLFAGRFLWWLSILLYPIIKLLDLFLKFVNKMVGGGKKSIVTEEELKSIIRMSEEEGSIKEIEKKMIQRIFDFDNTRVKDIMTRKKSVVSVSYDMHLKDVLQLRKPKLYSRYPVYEKNKDTIVGILHLKDMFERVKKNELDMKVEQIMRKPMFVFESKKTDAVLKMFQKRKEHMAVVINKKAQVVGLVTIENIVEEVVGEIIDESDRINPDIESVEKNEWFVKGTTEIEDLNSRTGIGIKKSEFDDLDDFVYRTLKRDPKVSEEIIHEKYRIIMEDVQGKKVIKARIVKI